MAVPTDRAFFNGVQDMITQNRVKGLFEYRDGILYRRESIKGAGPKGSRAGCKSVRYPYMRITVDGRVYAEHSLIFLMFKGYIPKLIDHILDDLTEEGIKSNRIDNLRDSDYSQNMQKKKRMGGSSEYRGVYWSKSREKWQSQIRIGNGKRKNLGRFDCEAMAARAYDKAALELHGENAGFNFPV